MCQCYKWFLERENNELLAPSSEVMALGKFDHYGIYAVFRVKSLEEADDKHSEASSQYKAAMVALYLPCSEHTWNPFSDYPSQ